MDKSEFLSLRRKIIEREFDKLNDMQKKAVFSTEGPLLVLAGAGSGKTTVLVNRIANIISHGNAWYSDDVFRMPSPEEEELLKIAAETGEIDESIRYLLEDYPAKPWQILAITFTNKAANELKDRLLGMIGPEADDIWAMTFHAACVRILRRNAQYIGFSSNFTIYDTDDSKRVIKDCIKQLGLNDKFYQPKQCISEISRAKDYLITPGEYAAQNSSDFIKKNIADIYELYQEKLRASDAMDFDDLICYTVQLLRDNPEILEYYQSKFRYILIDEYQDTNHLQYLLVSMLAAKYRNLCVVGDDDQSIYRFRGATIENILSFEEEYGGAKVIRLEQNYRSTQNILDAANGIISNNLGRKGKKLWTANGEGEKIIRHQAESDRDEGYFVAGRVLRGIREGMNYSDFAVLYRMNSQSNLVEQAFVRNGIPYRIIGGHKFYDRKEIKDAIAYLSVIANPNDTVRLARIINEPKRGIGDSTFDKLIRISEDLSLPVMDVMRSASDYPMLSRGAGKLSAFAAFIDECIEFSEQNPIEELLRKVVNESGYIDSLDLDRERKQDRLENLDQLVNNIKLFEENNEDATLNDFLQEISLMTDIDNYNSDSDSVVMMTVHSAKGLEFNTVFLIGMEENIFPSELSIQEGSAGIEEERRLAYVAVTRAKKHLFLSSCKYRMLFGMTRVNPESRFVAEIEQSLLEKSEENKREEEQRSRQRAYRRGTEIPRGGSKPKSRPDFPFKKPAQVSSETYKVGDTVRHKTFGEGVVLSASAMGNDTMLEVAFINGTTKKLMANFARLEKVK